MKDAARLQEYNSNPSREAKQKFRQKWAECKLKEITTSGKQSEKYATVNAEHGVYEPLSRIVELQGFAVDPKGAIRRGAEYVRKCIKLGGQWA